MKKTRSVKKRITRQSGSMTISRGRLPTKARGKTKAKALRGKTGSRVTARKTASSARKTSRRKSRSAKASGARRR